MEAPIREESQRKRKDNEGEEESDKKRSAFKSMTHHVCISDTHTHTSE